MIFVALCQLQAWQTSLLGTKLKVRVRGEMRGAGVRAGAMTRQQHLPPWLEILQPAGGCWPHGVKNVDTPAGGFAHEINDRIVGPR